MPFRGGKGIPSEDLQAPQANTKESVNYRIQNQRCNTCSNFNQRNGCMVVQGSIAPEAVCDVWTISEPGATTNTKEFFLPSGTIGNTIQFHITTDREIRTLKYEFGVTK